MDQPCNSLPVWRSVSVGSVNPDRNGAVPVGSSERVALVQLTADRNIWDDIRGVVGHMLDAVEEGLDRDTVEHWKTHRNGTTIQRVPGEESYSELNLLL